jgi:hypothetical protein
MYSNKGIEILVDNMVIVKDRSSIIRILFMRILKIDALIPAGLFFITIVSRIPFTSRILYHWDSVNFAYSIRDFNLVLEQPQPPGYILYVGLIRLVNGITQQAQMTMVFISIVASSLAVMAIYGLGKQMFSRRVGTIAALLLATSPLFWFYGEIALPHTLDAFLVILTTSFFYRVLRGEPKSILAAVLSLAIAGGVRQQTLVFLFPLALFSIRKMGWRNIVYAATIGALTCLVWMIPLFDSSGGIGNYFQVMGTFSTRFQTTTSIFSTGGLWGLRRNGIKLSMYSLYGIGFASIFLSTIPFVRKPIRWVNAFRDERNIFLLLWVIPAGLYYIFIHMGQQGLVFVYLPAIFLGLARLVDEFRQIHGKAANQILASVVVLNSVLFLFIPEYPIGTQTLRLLTRNTIQNSDEYFSQRINAIHQSFPPESTIIIANNWHHAEYYLPEYRVLPFNLGSKWEVDQNVPNNRDQDTIDTSPRSFGLVPDHKGGIYVVFFDSDLFQYNKNPSGIKNVYLKDGILNYQTMQLSGRIITEKDFYEVIPK